MAGDFSLVFDTTAGERLPLWPPFSDAGYAAILAPRRRRSGRAQLRARGEEDCLAPVAPITWPSAYWQRAGHGYPRWHWRFQVSDHRGLGEASGRVVVQRGRRGRGGRQG